MIRRLAPLALVLMLCACNTSAGMFADESDGSDDTDSSTVKSLMQSAGIIPTEKKPIDYAPRAPLALPSTSDLPAPQDRSQAQAAVDFPVDQDAQDAASIAAIRAEGGERDADNKRNPSEHVDARYLPGEIQATTPPKAVSYSAVTSGGTRSFGAENNKLTREEMKVVVHGANRTPLLNEDGTAAPRASLIVPPVEDRTPSAGAPLPDKGDIKNSEFINERLYQKDDRRPARMQDTAQPKSAVFGHY